jgi:AcrR family transcriptional regulator
MARKVKEQEYATKRNEMLDVARQLVYTKGYEQMSIQNILDALKISKGAFYHYFDSKPALLEALIDRMLEEGKQALLPILQDGNLSALEKIQRYFSSSVLWKNAQKDFLLALLPTWYSDDNTILRQKMTTEGIKSIGPPLAQIIRQGVDDGSFSTPYPEQAIEMCFYILQGLSDKIGQAVMAKPRPSNALQCIEKDVAAYTDALERVLGTPAGSMKFLDAESIRLWFD